ncbi:hypothetical protein As57867_016594, partial [Aphanomyces stellatus]
GGHLVSAAADATARVWHTATGACVQVLRGHDDHVVGAAFAYDGASIVTGGKDNVVRVWVDDTRRRR